MTKQEVSTIVRQLKAKYDEDGYLNARIQTELVPVEEVRGNRVVLKITIDEGQKVKVDYIRFYGNTQFNDDDLKGELKETSERTWWKFWTSNKFDKKKYEEDKKLILKFYQKNGYRDAEILADSISYSQDKQYLTIDFYVHEGPQYRCWADRDKEAACRQKYRSPQHHPPVLRCCRCARGRHAAAD